MRLARNEWCCVMLAVALVGPGAAGQQIARQTQRIWRFESDQVRISNAFPGGRLNDCQRLAPYEYRLLVRPENQPVNNSAWYAFQVTAREAIMLTVQLAYEGGRHRYYPHLSLDGRGWKLIDKTRYVHHREQESATLTLSVAAQQTLWVAGAEMIGVAEIEAWCQRLAAQSFVQRSLAGQSIGGRPLQLLTIGDRDAANLVFLISRQHPPEVTGTLALKAFVDGLCADQPLAKRFRAKFTTVVAPVLNPDGVTQGHWRHNNNGVDLNRDWRRFAQPETRQVRDAFLKCLSQPGARPFLFLDFHSTHRNLFYTQADRHETFPSDFTRHWLASLRRQFPEYQFRRQGSHNPRGGTSKSWAYEQFGIPAITYEVGDRMQPALVERFAQGAAQEAMKLLLSSLSEGAGRSAGDTRRGDGATP